MMSCEAHRRRRRAAAALVLVASCAHLLAGGLPLSFAQPQPNNATSSTLACVLSSLGQLSNSCVGSSSSSSSSSNGTAADSRARDTMTRLLRNCLVTTNGTAARRSARVLLVEGVFVSIMRSIASVYQGLSGIPTELVAVPFTRFSAVRAASVNSPSNQSVTHDAWMLTPPGMGDGMASGAFKDLTPLVGLDGRLEWEGLLQSVRTSALLYKNRVVGLPLSAWSSLLYFRQDVFDRNNIPVPQTWAELADFAMRYNGTENMWYFCGSWNPCTQLATGLVRLILAAYTQTRGNTQGWLVDPETLQPFFDSPAMREVLDILHRLYLASPPDGSQSGPCLPGSVLFQQSKCLVAVDVPSTFKAVSHTSRAASMAQLQGSLGFAPLPGSDLVLDRETNSLVACTMKRCPHATQDGGRLINRAPSFEGNLMAVNDKSPPDVGFYTFSLLSYYTSPAVSDDMVFHPDAEIYPARSAQYNPARWAAAGFNANDSRRFCSASLWALSHPNLNVHLRVPGASRIVTLLGEIGSNVTLALGKNASAFTVRQLAGVYAQVMATAQAKATGFLLAGVGGNRTALQAEYWASINRQLPGAPPPPPPSPSPQPPAPPLVAAGGGGSSHQLRYVLLGVCIAVPLAALASLAIFAWRKSLGRHSHGVRGAPVAGPWTTLCVTDIESSTALWEELEDPAVMDAALKLHNGCVRALAADHKGYESAWEGDSFILAFGHPSQALAFACDVQTHLLHKVIWPAQLLKSRHAEEVWVRRVRRRQRDAAGKRQGPSGLLNATSSVTRSAKQQPPAGDSSSTRLSDNGSGNVAHRLASGSSPRHHRAASALPPWQGQVPSSPDSLRTTTADNAHGKEKPLDGGVSASAPLEALMMTTASDVLPVLAPHQGPPAAAAAQSPSALPLRAESGAGSSDDNDGASLHVTAPLHVIDESPGPAIATQRSGPAATAALGPSYAAAPPALLLTTMSDGEASSALEDQASQLRPSMDSWQQVGSRPGAGVSDNGAAGRPARPKCWGEHLRHVWRPCPAGAPGAVLAFRGLRVRIGLHCGVQPGGVAWNPIMRRHQYTGAPRTLCGAVADAAHGGMVLLSGHTAQCLSSLGAKSAPDGTCFFFMGCHQLLPVAGDEAAAQSDLVLALPRALKCRLALRQEPLRTHHTLAHGVLHWPVPCTGGAVTAVHVRLAGVGTLLAWDQGATLRALRTARQHWARQLGVWLGVPSEECLGVPAFLAGHYANEQLGSASCVFAGPQTALMFALSLRQELLTAEWEEELLRHGLCEPIATFAGPGSLEGGGWAGDGEDPSVRRPAHQGVGADDPSVRGRGSSSKALQPPSAPLVLGGNQQRRQAAPFPSPPASPSVAHAARGAAGSGALPTGLLSEAISSVTLAPSVVASELRKRQSVKFEEGPAGGDDEDGVCDDADDASSRPSAMHTAPINIQLASTLPFSQPLPHPVPASSPLVKLGGPLGEVEASTSPQHAPLASAAARPGASSPFKSFVTAGAGSAANLKARMAGLAAGASQAATASFGRASLRHQSSNAVDAAAAGSLTPTFTRPSSRDATAAGFPDNNDNDSFTKHSASRSPSAAALAGGGGTMASLKHRIKALHGRSKPLFKVESPQPADGSTAPGAAAGSSGAPTGRAAAATAQLLDAPMLRGLRPRFMLVLQGQGAQGARVQLLSHMGEVSLGRAVLPGRSARDVAAQMARVRAGQILVGADVAGALMAAGQHPLAISMDFQQQASSRLRPSPAAQGGGGE